MTNPLTSTPAFVSKRELWLTMLAVFAILIFISVITTLTLTSSGNPDREIYVFPQNTYICTNEEVGDVLERVCTIKEATAPTVIVPPEASVDASSNVSESTLQTEVTK